MATWYDKLRETLEAKGEAKWECTAPVEALQVDAEDLVAFTAWGEKWVYFPCWYDSERWVDCVPRNPCDIATLPVGAG